MYIQILCTYYFFAACACGSLAVQRDWNAPSISLLLRLAPFITSFSPSTAKEKRQKPQWSIRADRQENDLQPTHTHMVTFSGDSEVILQHSGFFLKRSEVDLSPRFRLTSSLHLLYLANVSFKLNFSLWALNHHCSTIIAESKTPFCKQSQN